MPRRESLLLIVKDRRYSEERLADMMARKNAYYREYLRALVQPCASSPSPALQETRG